MTARAWTYGEETELRALWGDDAVIGKANRMGLAPRPSPIKTKKESKA